MNVTKRVTSHAYKHTLTVPLSPDIPLHSFAFRPIRLNSSLNRSYANYYYVDLWSICNVLLQLKYTNSIFLSTLLWSYYQYKTDLINWGFCSKHNIILWYYYNKGNEIYIAYSWSKLENNYCMVKVTPSLKTYILK